MVENIAHKVAKIPKLDKERLESLTIKEKVKLASKLAECGGSASWNSLVRVVDKVQEFNKTLHTTRCFPKVAGA